jgi:polar amino acid transport system substrate-binding protein
MFAMRPYMNEQRSRVALGCAGFVLALMASFQAPARSLQEVRNQGIIRVGIALATPWAMRDRQGELIGFDVDVATQLASDLRVRANLVVYDWEELIGAIEANEVDIVVAGLTITPDRALSVNFSHPHSTGGVALATNLQTTATVDVPEYSLAVVADSVAQELARRLLPRMSLREFDTAEAAGEALIVGEVDAYLEEEPVPTFLALDNPGKIDVPISRPLLETKTGFAIGKGDVDFLAYLDAWIVAREADTWLPTTHNYWFKSLRWRDRLADAGDF